MAWGDKGDAVRICGVSAEIVREMAIEALDATGRLASHVAALDTNDLAKLPPPAGHLARAAQTLYDGIIQNNGPDSYLVARRRSLRVQLVATLMAMAEVLDGG